MADPPELQVPRDDGDDLPSDRPTNTPPSGSRRLVPALLVVATVFAVAVVAAAWLRTGAVAPTLPAAGGAPRIALFDPRRGLAVEDAAGRRTILAAPADTNFGFPAWSPDGTRIAVVSNGDAGPMISVYAVPPPGSSASAAAGDASAAPSPSPVVVYRNADIPPFYVYWTPDGRRVSFLATDTDGISLRVAPADGSGPLDGSGPGALIRRGAPLYFDWIDDAHLLLHVGNGSGSFAGETGPDGTPAGPALDGPGDFRSAVVSADRTTIAWVRGTVPSAEVVLAARDGSNAHTVPVFGPAAVVFDPTSNRIATIAAADAASALTDPFPFPLGPLRLVDPSTGAVRTLIDGRVVGFFWAPDGKTIAALRLQPAAGSTEAVAPIVQAAARIGASAPSLEAAAPSAAPSPTPAPSDRGEIEIHLVFADVASGAVRSERTVRLTSNFLNQFLPYFDQYALSHRLWASDSSALLLPMVDATGESVLAVLPPSGGPSPRTTPAVNGFWSP